MLDADETSELCDDAASSCLSNVPFKPSSICLYKTSFVCLQMLHEDAAGRSSFVIFVYSPQGFCSMLHEDAASIQPGLSSSRCMKMLQGGAVCHVCLQSAGILLNAA
ncbi:unnamed protein product [Durusdinium trenchii]|uniref:Uncharacterized protein n=1 Tax=Durusdinium trenchii TaxID=1381693 RepID=A0ABP0RA19_9DINO